MAGTLGIEPSANSPIFQARGNGCHGGIRLRIRFRTKWDNWADIERANPGMAALVLPHVMNFNLSHCADLYAELAPYIMHSDVFKSAESLSLAGSSSNSQNQSSSENKLIADNQIGAEEAQKTAKLLVHYLHSLITKLNLPQSLSELGIEEKHIDSLANDALEQQRLLVNNPKPVSLDDAVQIYRHALTGKL